MVGSGGGLDGDSFGSVEGREADCHKFVSITGPVNSKDEWQRLHSSTYVHKLPNQKQGRKCLVYYLVLTEKVTTSRKFYRKSLLIGCGVESMVWVGCLQRHGVGFWNGTCPIAVRRFSLRFRLWSADMPSCDQSKLYQMLPIWSW